MHTPPSGDQHVAMNKLCTWKAFPLPRPVFPQKPPRYGPSQPPLLKLQWLLQLLQSPLSFSYPLQTCSLIYLLCVVYVNAHTEECKLQVSEDFVVIICPLVHP